MILHLIPNVDILRLHFTPGSQLGRSYIYLVETRTPVTLAES